MSEFICEENFVKRLYEVSESPKHRDLLGNIGMENSGGFVLTEPRSSFRLPPPSVFKSLLLVRCTKILKRG